MTPTQTGSLRRRILTLALVSVAGTLAVGLGSAHAATITVTSGGDTGAGTLRAALAAATNGDMVTFSPSVTEVELTSAQLLINTGVTITGPGADALTVRRSSAGGTPTFRVFRITPGAGNTAAISGLTISGGSATPGGGISFTGGTGTQLNLVRVAVIGNTADWGGGLDLAGSQTSAVTIDSSTVTGNTTSPGPFMNGAGMKIEVPTTIVNSTISGNAAGTNGGGMKVDSNVTIINSTIANNSAVGVGGGIWVTRFSNNPNLVMKNTLVAGNTAGVSGLQCKVDSANTTLSVNLNNLIEDGSCNFLWASRAVSGSATNFLSGDPGLAALVYNGGTTKTQALASSSIARAVGDSTACTASPVSGIDQRGVSRPSLCSIGAFDGSLSAPTPIGGPETPATSETPASSSTGAALSAGVTPRRLALRSSRSADGRTFSTAGAVPDGADRVVIVAVRGATGAERMLLGMREAVRVQAPCVIAGRAGVRTFTCNLRLGRASWTVTTRAMAGSTTLARAVSRVRVRVAPRVSVTG